MTDSDEQWRIRRDFAWNVGAFGIVGLSGIALNAVIARFWDANTLGVFNQLLTLQIILGQAAVFGVHYSSLRYTAVYRETGETLGRVLGSALAIVLVLSTALTAALWLLRFQIGDILKSDALVQGMYAALTGMWLVAINKLLTAILNGARAMRLFAIVQAARPFALLCSVFVIARSGDSGALLPWAFSVAELFVFFVCVISFATIGMARYLRPVFDRQWFLNHVRFGWRTSIAGWLSESNTRSDILIVGVFLDDTEVGIYSAASTLVEGLVQFPAILRSIANPLITNLILRNEYQALRDLKARFARTSAMSMSLICVAAVAIFPMYVNFLLKAPIYLEAWRPFAFACTGLAAASWILPFEFFFVQSGQPALHLTFKSLSVAATIIPLLLLVDSFGIDGAGLAMGIGFIASSVVLAWMIRRELGKLTSR